jgi:hypothetical protein
VINEALTSDPKFGAEYMGYIQRVVNAVFVKSVARWPEDKRELVRSKIACLLVMMQRIEFHILCQELNFPGGSPLDAIAEIWWRELFQEPSDLGTTV